jgi:DNA-directed RNA polymerase specialized sigma24 family protein
VAAVEHCAPALAAALARVGVPVQSPDTHAVAGRLLLELAERWRREQPDGKAVTTIAESLVMECISSGLLELTAPAVPDLPLGAAVADPARLTQALESLGSDRLRILALVTEEGLSISEAAQVLGLPEQEVHQQCAEAIGRLRQQLPLADGPARCPSTLRTKDDAA